MNKPEILWVPEKKVRHNHLTRDIRPPGVCPKCDEYHEERRS